MFLGRYYNSITLHGYFYILDATCESTCSALGIGDLGSTEGSGIDLCR